MAITLNDNISVEGPKPDGARYFNKANRPYENVGQVFSELTESVRHEGLTVNVKGIEYWFPDGINLVVKTNGSEGVIDISYSDIMTLITTSGLTAGSQYRINDYATVHYMLDYGANKILTNEDIFTSAPSNISMLSDAIGTHPTTYYCVAFGLYDEDHKYNDTFRSEISKEFTYIEGDSTQEVLFNCDFEDNKNIDYTGIVILRGTESGVYTSDMNCVYNSYLMPYNIFGQFINEDVSKFISLKGYPINLINIGETEALIVMANSTNTLDKIAKSENYPQDLIYYDWNPDNWLHDGAFSDYYDNAINNPESIMPVTGFKGVIYFRHDTYNDNYMRYDFRNVKYRRWESNVEAWVEGQAYSKFSFVTYNNVIYVSTINGISSKGILSGGNDWLYVADINSTKYLVGEPYYNRGNLSAGLGYIDVKTFAIDPTTSSNATYEKCCKSNHFLSNMDNVNGSILTNNVFFMPSGTVPSIYNNIFGCAAYGNTIYGGCYNNNINNYMTWINIISGINNCKIADNFHNNIIGGMDDCSIDSEFSYNIIGNSFMNNIIGNSFMNNIISNSFNSNNISNSFMNNIIANGFNNNIVKNAVNYCNIFTSNLHDCEFDSGVSVELSNFNTNFSYKLYSSGNNYMYIEWFDQFYDRNILSLPNNDKNK